MGKRNRNPFKTRDARKARKAAFDTRDIVIALWRKVWRKLGL